MQLEYVRGSSLPSPLSACLALTFRPTLLPADPEFWTPPPDGSIGAGEGASILGAAVTANQGLKKTGENLLGYFGKTLFTISEVAFPCVEIPNFHASICANDNALFFKSGIAAQ
jgi:hypothetical protein